MNTRPPIRIELSDVEYKIVRHIAGLRQKENEAARIRDNKHSPRASVDLHEQGFAGELAFCKYFNVYPDLTTEPRQGGPDCERFGETIDVKTARIAHGNLLVLPLKNKFEIERYALLIAPAWPKPIFDFVGFAAPADIFTPEHFARLSTGPAYRVPQAELKARQISFLDEE